ncbi:MAG: D-isomer specific 2-hydroxyacid dehydrogenase family protein [Actinomycetota bacterium]
MTRIAVLPSSLPILSEAIERAGAIPIDDPTIADAIVWADPSSPAKLKAVLEHSNARWVQLPFAGIESFFDSGAIDDSRVWTCAKGIYGPATAEHAFALTLAAAHQLHRHARATEWSYDLGARRLDGTTAVVIGTGGIGESYARFVKPLGVRLLAVNRSGSPAPWADQTTTSDSMLPFIDQADWIVVAAASTSSTKHLINGSVLGRMRSDAWIINVARGSLIDTNALIAALESNRIGGAALDVTEPEPLPKEHVLWRLPNVIITSHSANPFRLALGELSALLERNVARFITGEPLEGLVDVKLGY